MAGQRRKFTAIRCLIEIKQNECQITLTTEEIEQRFQTTREFAGSRDICSHITSKVGKEFRIMVTIAANMQLHYQPIFNAHTRHFDQHMTGKTAGILLTGLTFQCALEYDVRLALAEPFCIRRLCRVVSGSRPYMFEEMPPLFECRNIRTIICHIHARDLAQILNLRGVASLNVDDSIRAKRWNYSPRPARGTDTLMVFQCSGSGIGRCQHFNMEALEQVARLEFGTLQSLVECIVDALRIGRVDLLFDTKDSVQFIAQPETCWRTTEEIPVIADGLPDFAVVFLYMSPIPTGNSQSF